MRCGCLRWGTLRSLVVVLILMVLGLVPVSAQPQGDAVPLRRSADPVRLAFPSPELHGLRLGHSPEEVINAITVLAPGMVVERRLQRLTVTVNGRQVASAPYTSEIRANNRSANPAPIPTTSVSVVFALPTTGGGAVAISFRQDAAPTLNPNSTDRVMAGGVFATQLIQAFGPPTYNGSVQPDAPVDPSDPSSDLRGMVSMYWRFSTTARIACRAQGCPIDAADIELKKLSDYEEAVRRGEVLRINARAYPFPAEYSLLKGEELTADLGKVKDTQVTIEDVANKALSLREAVQQLMETDRAGGPPR